MAKLVHKKSSVAGNEPDTNDLMVGEIAINLADAKLYTRDTNDTVIELGPDDSSTLPIKADTALSKGDVLYATGAVGNSSTITASKFIANGTVDELYVIGVAEKDMAIGDIGKAVSFGRIKGFNTTSYVVGTILYASETVAGSYTATKPTAPNQAIPVAMVLSSDSNGILFVRPTNGFHLSELHDVDITNPSTDDILKWDGSKWVNGSPAAPTAPQAPSIQSTTTVGETIEVLFNASATTALDRYEVWSDAGTGSYGLIAVITSDDFSATMSVIDTSFEAVGTINYRVYAIKDGMRSIAATASHVFALAGLETTNLRVVADIHAYHIEYDLPDSRFLDHIEIKMDSDPVSTNVSYTAATLIYSGLRTAFTYDIPQSALDNYHQFWVECVEV